MDHFCQSPLQLMRLKRPGNGHGFTTPSNSSANLPVGFKTWTPDAQIKREVGGPKSLSFQILVFPTPRHVTNMLWNKGMVICKLCQCVGRIHNNRSERNNLYFALLGGNGNSGDQWGWWYSTARDSSGGEFDHDQTFLVCWVGTTQAARIVGEKIRCLSSHHTESTKLPMSKWSRGSSWAWMNRWPPRICPRRRR